MFLEYEKNTYSRTLHITLYLAWCDDLNVGGAGCFLQVVVVKLKMDKDRKAILERKARARQKLDKGKHTEESIMETS